MTGLPDIGLRIPKEYSAEFMRILIRDVLRLADSRNATGVGILVTGDGETVATYEVDSQNVDLAEGLETRSILAAMRNRLDILELQVKRGKVREYGLTKRIEELEASEAVFPINSLKKRIEELEIEVA